MFVHRSMLSDCLGNFLTNGTPFLWGGITFMFLHQVTWFKLLWMCPKVGHKFSLEPIGKKTTPSLHFFLGVLMRLVISTTLSHFYPHYVKTSPPFHQQTILQSPYIGLYVICWPMLVLEFEVILYVLKTPLTFITWNILELLLRKRLFSSIMKKYAIVLYSSKMFFFFQCCCGHVCYDLGLLFHCALFIVCQFFFCNSCALWMFCIIIPRSNDVATNLTSWPIMGCFLTPPSNVWK